MMDLQERMRETLKGIVAEHELEAVLDVELTAARENLKREARSAAQSFFREEMKKYMDRWVASDEAKTAIVEMGKQLVEAQKAEWLAGGDYKLKEIKEKISRIFDQKVDSEIQSQIGYNGQYAEDINKAAHEALEQYMPKAVALALEGLAVRALRANLIKAEVSMGLSDGVRCSDNEWGCQGKVVPGMHCADCGTFKHR